MYLVIIYAQQIKALMPEDGQLCTADQESTGLRPALLYLILRFFAQNIGFLPQTKAFGTKNPKTVHAEVEVPKDQQLPLWGFGIPLFKVSE